MDKKDLKKYKDFDSYSETSSLGSDESLEEVGGPNFADFAKQLAYEKSIEPRAYYHPFDTFKKPDDGGTYEFPSTITEKVEPPKTTDVTTLFLIDSLNRDRSAFPQPTNFTLKLPRVYKGIKSIQLTQIKLLCSFYYFSDSTAKSNIYLPVTEKGREKVTTYNKAPLTNVITIRQGTYGINDLLSEIQTQMNYTPLFYDFPNGFTDFVALFTFNGDFTVNFNQPGDSYYDALNSKYIQNPTMATILSYYWGTRYAGLTEYTINQVIVAYYYPVIYEVLLDKNYKNTLNLSSPNLKPGESAYNHLISNMTGINDAIAYDIAFNNIDELDKYRLKHTFRYSLVNRYQLAYDSNSLQVNFITTSLNTSLVNLINNTTSSALSGILSNLNLTQAAYATLQSTVNKASVIYRSMFQFLQKQFIDLLGIPFGTYSPQYINNVRNTIYFQNGLNAENIRAGYTIEYLRSGEQPLSSMTVSLISSPKYWPNLKGIPLGTINSPTSLIPYSITSKNYQFGNTIIDSSNYFLNTNKASRSVDAIVKILPAQYTVFKFRSSARQTLQVETLPLPYYYRYSDYNKAGNYKGVLDLNKRNVPQQYFDLSYNFVYNSVNSNMDIARYSPTVLYPIFGQSLDIGISTITNLQANSASNYTYFEFIAPYPLGNSSGLFAYNTNISFICMSTITTNVSTLFPDSFSAFVYHDRGAFMADLNSNFIRNENPLHYIETKSVSRTNSDLTIHFSTFSGHKYYTIFRSNNRTCLNTFYKPVIHYTDSNYVTIQADSLTFDPNANPYIESNLSTNSYVTNYNTDFTRLPTRSSLMGLDPTSSTFNVTLSIKQIPIGYDASGISNDLTDYPGYTFGQSGVDLISQDRIDPLSYYSFQFLTPFDSINGTYFGDLTSNAILEPITQNIYSWQQTSTSEIKIVHWYDNFSIPIQSEDAFTGFETIGIARRSTISDYIMTYPSDASGNIILGRGINSIGFLPNDGLFDVSSFSFKSAIYPLTDTEASPEDPNLDIAFIGVFNGLSLANNSVSLSTAITLLRFEKAVPYGPNTLSNTPGFGSELGTWYSYLKDPDFIPLGNGQVSGYTPNSTDLLSYDSMYYMVPFNSNGATLTYSALAGSLLPYPLAQTISTSSTFYGQITLNTQGTNMQTEYVIPIVDPEADPAYGPQGTYSQSQSQYARSIPITTPSIGFKQYPYLVSDSNAPFSFKTDFSSTIKLTTYFTEYSDNLYIVNAANGCSNDIISFPTSNYTSSLTNLVRSAGGNLSSIHYLVNPPPILQNYSVPGNLLNSSTFTFQSQADDNSNVTIQSFEVLSTMSNITVSMWGGGGGTWKNTSSITGGAGAYAKFIIDVGTLLSTGISTLYMVVGKGGNRDNVEIDESVGTSQLYEEPRYGGGGTAILGKYVDGNSIALQGGGFSGIFTDSNLLIADPLFIVGGGGAAGSVELGGPGGFGPLPEVLESQPYPFSDATCEAMFYNPLQISAITDVFSNPVNNGFTVANVIDSDTTMYWNPTVPSVMNPGNYRPTDNTYGITIEFSDNLTYVSKLRYYGPPVENTSNLPTGILVYNEINKSQLLYSNTNIQLSDFEVVDNGDYLQHVYEIYPDVQVLESTITKVTWLTAGVSESSEASIQYSLDNISWVPTQNSFGPVNSILYASDWYAAGSTITTSTDGITWTACTVVDFTGTKFNTLAYGSDIYLAGGDDGSIFISTDGETWTYTGTKFSQYVSRIRFLNGYFWAMGGSDYGLKQGTISGDTVTWRNITSINAANDIAYGLGQYVIVMTPSSPYFSPILYSMDGLIWYKVSPTNIYDFTGISIVYANNTFVAVGSTIDDSSFIKYSRDGNNWLSSRYNSSGDTQRNNVEFANNTFISTGTPIEDTLLAGNQTSIIQSVDGITWSYSLSGGFTEGYSSAYGPITVIPNMSTLYMEIQTTSLINPPIMYELRAYDVVAPVPVATDALVLGTPFNPPEEFTIDVIEYPFLFNLPEPAPIINKLQIYSPDDGQFTNIRVEVDSQVVYTGSNVYQGELYEVLFVPELENISTLNITFTKVTEGSLQINSITPVYDPNTPVVQLEMLTVNDVENRPSLSVNTISNVIDNRLSTYWTPNTFLAGDTLKLSFTFSPDIERINHIQIYNGLFANIQTNVFTSIGLYTDRTKSVLVYSNASPQYKEYKDYSLVEFDTAPLIGYSTLYMELKKTTFGKPVLNEIRFFNIGLPTDIPDGYSGGNSVTMLQSNVSVSPYDGGGGSTDIGGNGGPIAYTGSYLKGGSPAIIPTYLTVSSITEIQGGSGGGGGGYYGGGGGGLINSRQGGAGGGGSGFYSLENQIFTLIDYDVADPKTNYISPGLDEQQNLKNDNIIRTLLYGRGGDPSLDNGQGQHGLIVISYESSSTVVPPVTTPVSPSFIDGSKLIVYQAPVTYSDTRKLSFSPVIDSIQYTPYKNYNWVWYNAYLSLVGCSLTNLFDISGTLDIDDMVVPDPDNTWPFLPEDTYNSLSTLFPSVVEFFNTFPITAENVSAISTYLSTTFQQFQAIFIQVPYTDPSYYEMTEIYCLLDYLQKPENLQNPHAASGSLDRIFGGIPRFGYWANPFFTNASYLGFDVTSGQIPIPELSTLVQNSDPVQAFYGLVMEQSLKTGVYEFRDVMAYKPTYDDLPEWHIATQFPEAYAVRTLTDTEYLASNVIVQPYTFQNAISARLPLFKYSVYTVPTYVDSTRYDIPVHILNDFQGKPIMYSFYNTDVEDISSIHITNLPFTSTMINMNQQNINRQIGKNTLLGTLVSEYDTDTEVNVITRFGFNGTYPIMDYSPQFYNTFSEEATMLSKNVGKALIDVYGNYFLTEKNSSVLYENIATDIVYAQPFSNNNVPYVSPKHTLGMYNSSITVDNSEFFVSKFTNIWHVPANGNISTIYGVRLTSPYDFTVLTNFVNQVFYPAHKITLVKNQSLVNPIKDTTDTQTYPSYQHTEMFFYKNYSTMVKDISGQFAMESPSNFSYSDMSSGYGFNSYIYNITLPISTDFNNDNADSFNYLAIRAYSPSETFQSLVRFYLPQRYDFGYISLRDLSNEQVLVNTNSNVNPDYKSFLSVFNAAFSTTRNYGGVGLPGFAGSNITTTSFGDFLTQFNALNIANIKNSATVSTVSGMTNAAVTNLITGDLQYILPSSLANRNRPTDPLQFMLPFSSCVTPSNANIEAYGIGYNLGFPMEDTGFNTVQRAGSFFKILDDAIFLRLNPEFGMNKMDISQPENFAQTLDTTAQSGLYNSKLMLNTFGSFATTFVQSPVSFNPLIGKLDKLSFSWYNSAGVLLNNADCEWSGSVQIVESVTASA